MPNLEAIPFPKRPQDNDSFCRLELNPGGGGVPPFLELIVEVHNTGNAPSPPTRVRVDFRKYGTVNNPNDRVPQERPLPILQPVSAGGIPARLAFDPPCIACYDPRCAFDIIIDPGGPLENFYRGVCQRGPDLVPIPAANYLATGFYFRKINAGGGNRDIEVRVQNQGTADSVAARLSVAFPNNPTGFQAIPPLVPSQIQPVRVRIPAPLTGVAFQPVITLDVDNVVEESNKDNNTVRNEQCGP